MVSAFTAQESEQQHRCAGSTALGLIEAAFFRWMSPMSAPKQQTPKHGSGHQHPVELRRELSAWSRRP